METPIINIILITIAYLFGSISSAILLCYTLKLPDPRAYGSNNPGTTNAFRIGGKKLAAAVFIADFLKGFLTVLIMQQLTNQALIVAIASLAVFLGQLFPIFFQFKGGKGIAITFGIISAFYWPLACLLLSIWLIIFLITKISSLAGIITTIVACISSFWLPNKYLSIALFIMGLFILIRHKQNIKQLINKNEKHINFS